MPGSTPMVVDDSTCIPLFSASLYSLQAIRWPEDHNGRQDSSWIASGLCEPTRPRLERAHDASADVVVTVRLARRLALHDSDLFASCLKRIDKHFVTDQIRADGRIEGLFEVTPFAGWDRGFVRDLWIHFDYLSVQMTM